MQIKNKNITAFALAISLVACVSAKDAKGNFDENFSDPGKQIPTESHEVVKDVAEQAFERVGNAVEGFVGTVKGVITPSDSKSRELVVVEMENNKVTSETTVPVPEDSPTSDQKSFINQNNEQIPADKIASENLETDLSSVEENGSDKVASANQTVETREKTTLESFVNTLSSKSEEKGDEQSKLEKVEGDKIQDKTPQIDEQQNQNAESVTEKIAPKEENGNEDLIKKEDDSAQNGENQDKQESSEEIASQNKIEKNNDENLIKKGDDSAQNGENQDKQESSEATLTPEPTWAQNLKEVAVEVGADGVVAYAIYNGIDAAVRLGKLVVAVADDEVVEADAQGEGLFTKSETAKILISCASAGALRALLGESALAASIKQDGRVVAVVLATLVGNQLIVHGVPGALKSAITNYPKSTIAAGLSTIALVYCCKDAVGNWIAQQSVEGVVGNNAVLLGACGIAAMAAGVTLITWLHNTYGPRKSFN